MSMHAYLHDFAVTVTTYARNLLPVLGVCLALELLLPLGKAGFASRFRATRFWVAYIFITAAFFAAFNSLWSKIGIRPLFTLDLSVLSHAEHSAVRWPAYIAIAIISTILGDFFYYWFHRLQHTSSFLWRFHEVHHAIRDMNAINSAHHWTEEIFRIPFIVVPMTLLINWNTGYVPAIIAAIMGAQGIYEHSATRINLGWFRYIIPDNRFHRMHHSIHKSDWNRNFGSGSAIWDIIFRTARFPRRNEWPEVGVPGVAEPRTMADYLFMPFRRRNHAITARSTENVTTQ
ncbi:sterol desaturase family protein [Burkholderia sp. Nafp2/4-1b]|nr:sterol desaturase family protein [Burkholderia sp. Nafp2/4-1b]